MAVIQKIFSKLSQLKDVLLGTPSDGEVLRYESASNMWKNGSLGTADVSGLEGALDAKLNLRGGIMSGSLDAGGYSLLNIGPNDQVGWRILTPGETTPEYTEDWDFIYISGTFYKVGPYWVNICYGPGGGGLSLSSLAGDLQPVHNEWTPKPPPATTQPTK